MAVNVIEDIVKHRDEEIIEFLYRTMNGVLKNYDVSVKAQDSALLWGNIGDISMVANVLKAMNARNQEKLAQTRAE